MSSEGMDVFRRGLRPPSLCKQLQSILRQYEDSGQILKELLQNADDAKASRVVFLYDKTQHSTAPEDLLHPGLGKYQGPALFAYNDAVFTKDDWENILLLHDSKKATDKMKVGRFGLGFKSVFHITDLPEVLSGHNIGAVEPHERLFTYDDDIGMPVRTSAKDWKLSDLIRSKSLSKLSPFMSEVFFDGDKGLVGDHFPGTVFRFPLRCEAHKSLLSDNLYDDRKARLLLDSLSVESEMSLLFLKNIEKIEIFERQPNAKPQRLLTIEITQNTLANVRRARQHFLQCVEESICSENAEPVKVDYNMSIETVKYEAGAVKERRETSWMVVQYLGGGRELWSAIHDKYPGAKHLPWVSTAVRLGAPPTEPAGHVFCFLPLPLVPENHTGLHMHVNGYFAVDSSRRYLKWPSLDQKEVTDPEMLWNQFLLEKVLPTAMVELIVSCIHEQNQTSVFNSDLIYSLIPDPANPSLKVSMWRDALPSFFNLLVSKAVFFKQEPDPGWLQWSEGIMSPSCFTENEENVIRSIFLEAGQPFIEPPFHVRASFETATGTQAEQVSPSRVRSLLHLDPSLTEGLEKEERLTMLQYVLSDGAHWEMPGISHLLPLADGSFSCFDQSWASPVFIDNLDMMRLLPGTQISFLQPQLSVELQGQLEALAQSDSTQLKQSTLNTFPQLMVQIWQHSQELTTSSNTNFNKQWLKQVWKFICQNYEELEVFEGLYLIPTGTSSLAILSREHPVIERCSAACTLPETIIDLLGVLNVTVINQLPREFCHPDIRTYVNAANPQGLVTCLCMLNIEQVVSSIENMSEGHKVELRKFFVKDVDSLSHHVRLVRSLPIFQLLGKNGFCSAEVTFVAPLSRSPFPIYKDIIALSDDATKTLVKFLGLTILTEAKFLMEFVLPFIRQNKYTQKVVVGVIADILNKLSKLSQQEKGFGALLRDMPFIETGSSNALQSPCNLFDPFDPVLKPMFLRLNELPHGKFAIRKYVDILKQIGLKCQADVSQNDILRIAELIEKRQEGGENLLNEATALITFLSTQGEMLFGNLVAKLSRRCWVPVVQQRPFDQHFPSQLPWGGHDLLLARPDQVIAARFAPIVGSVQPLVSVDDAQLASIGKAFHWESAKLQTVLSHLKNLTECYCNEMRAPAMMMMTKIYEFLNQHEAHTVLSEIKSIGLDTYVWNDNGFVSPRQFMLSTPPFTLEPYVYSLPTDMYKFHTLLSGLGVEETVELTSVLAYIRDYHHSRQGESDAIKQEVDRDLGIVLSIINKIESDGSDTTNLLIPVHTQDGHLRMMDISEVCYCDKEWYQKGKDEDDVVEDDEKHIYLIHPKISIPIAEKLKVPSMTSQLLDSEPMAFGQSESLTRRLHTLLHDYSDGLAVLKELIQNADDAGAKEIRFLYDERKHLDARTYLFDKNMADLQGPALLAYNDAEFSEADFDSIVKLSAGSKLDQTPKVGRFGLGFNAVYNLTDVPFFVSNGKFVVFDPHRRYLEKALRSCDPPGLKLDVNKQRRKIKKLADQFKPFEGIFGCRILDNEDIEFKGTLFRFPLRTTDQAHMSEISKKHYADRAELTGLLQLLVNCADSILLFLQNVLKLTIWHLPESAAGPSDMELLCTFERNHARSLRSYDLNLSDFHFLNHVDKEMRRQVSQNPCGKAVRNNLVRVTSAHNHEGALGLDLPASQRRDTLWLVSQAMGQGQSLKMCQSDKTLLPVGGVAVPVTPGGCRESDLDPTPVEHSRMFCFLPLPSAEPLDLPVHVNGYFSVTSDRRHVFEQDHKDKDDVRAQWNQALMTDAVTLAYVNLLEDLSNTGNAQKVSMMWPDVKCVRTNSSLVESLKISVYKLICRSGGPSVFPTLISSDNGSKPIFIPFESSVFLDTDLLQSDIKDAAYSAFACIEEKKAALPLLDYQETDKLAFVSLSITQSLKAVFGDQNQLNVKLYNITKFYSDIFMPNVAIVDSSKREQLLKFALLNGDGTNGIHNLLRTHACIPVSPDGQRLQRPDRLVHPGCPLADLFSPEDGRTPYFEDQLQRQVLERLVEVGMVVDDLPWDEVLDRCQSVNQLYQNNLEQGVKRIKAIVQLIDNKLNTETPEECPESVKIQIQQTGFLPVYPKPNEYMLSWAGDQFKGVCLPPQNMYLCDHKDAIGSVKPIVDHKVIQLPPSRVLKHFLDLNRRPQLDLVLSQLDVAMTTTENANSDGKRQLGDAFKAIYSFLNNECKDGRRGGPLAAKVAKRLRGIRCIYTSDKMCLPQECARNGPHRPPYLHQLPDMLQHSHENLLQTLGVKLAFNIDDFIVCLTNIFEKHHQKALSVHECRMATDTVRDLAKCRVAETTDLKKAVIYVPDVDMVMCDARDLCFNNCQWLKLSDAHYCHTDITWENALAVGVRTIREAHNEKNSIGIGFGQAEELTNRIRRILTGYPFDKEVFNELLQNADDAGATDIHFVLDLRTHGTERLFEDSWHHLQGPALCVYNNSPFTLDDIEGIQKLGQGNKDLDPTKTGQYGVGFNCVYHLTDTPTILTDVEGEGLLLCAFDPNLLYVPCATKSEPGRLYTVTPELRQTYSDVFGAYLHEHLSVENATIFRFPLRSAYQASMSHLSKKEVQPDHVREMFDKYIEHGVKSLLFLNNIKSVKISEISKEGNISLLHHIWSKSSIEDLDKPNQLRDKLLAAKRQLSDESISDIQPFESIQQLTLKNNADLSEEWLIVQRIGLIPGAKISEGVLTAHRRKEMCLLPRGGVAYCTKSSSLQRERGRWFCMLPLPIETDLPVHFNGHFALDYENRRNVWKHDSKDAKTDWNNLLMEEIIAPAYVSLIKKQKETVKDSEHEVALYERTFPKPSSVKDDSYVGTLARVVYKDIANNSIPVLPAFVWYRHGATPVLEWFPPIASQSQDQVYFSNLEQQMQTKYTTTDSSRWFFVTIAEQEYVALLSTLQRLGVPIVVAMQDIHRAFEAAEIETQLISPDVVIAFLLGHDQESSRCHVAPGLLPANIRDTTFSSEVSLHQIFSYCLRSESINIISLPLQLRQDDMLTTFTSDKPIFVSIFAGLLPKHKALFIHRMLLDIMKICQKYKKLSDTATLRDFKLTDFVGLIGELLPEERFGTGIENIPVEELEMLLDGVTCKKWLALLWEFMVDDIRKEDHEFSCEQTKESLVQMLRPVQSWSLLPVFQADKAPICGHVTLGSPKAVYNVYLVPIRKITTTVNLLSGGYMNEDVRDALIRLNIPQPYFPHLDGLRNKSYTLSVLNQMLGNIETPMSVIGALEDLMDRELLSFDHVNDSSRRSLHDYFDKANAKSNFSPNECSVLKKLPIYANTRGKHVALSGRNVIVLSYNVPTAGADIFEHITSSVFLQECQWSDFHGILGSRKMMDADFYTEMCLQNRSFCRLQERDRLVHLKHVRDRLLPVLKNSGRVINCLKQLQFLKDRQGNLTTASSFYDKTNPVFASMHEDIPQPQSPYNEEEWRQFLIKCGMTSELNADMFVEYAKFVEAAGQRDRSKKVAEISKVLVEYLRSRFEQNDASFNSKLLQRVKNIRFIVPHRVCVSLTSIHPQLGAELPGPLPFIAFEGSALHSNEMRLWTAVHLLPYFASSSLSNSQTNRDFIQNLGICTSEEQILPNLVKNFKNICKRLGDGLLAPSIDQHKYKTVMKSCYRELNKKLAMKDMIARELSDVAIAAVEEWSMLKPAYRLCTDITFDDEIKPYLFKIPNYLANYENLFVSLGAQKKPTLYQYAMTLEGIYQTSQREENLPNEKDKIRKAVQGLFKVLLSSNEPNIQCITKLYLPSEEPDAKLHKSTSLVCTDLMGIRCRIRNATLIDSPFMLDLKEFGINDWQKTLKRLPQHLQPIMLSAKIAEKFAAPGSPLSSEEVEERVPIQSRLQSREFMEGLKRLSYHKMNEGSNTTWKETKEKIDTSCQHIKAMSVKGFEVLRTSLTFDGENVEDSEIEVPFYFKPSSDESKVVLYLGEAQSLSWYEFSKEMSHHFYAIRCCGAGRTMLFDRPVAEISISLDKRQVPLVDSPVIEYIPQLGSYVPVKLHPFLENDLREMFVGDYAALEIDDPVNKGKEGVAEYIFIKILERLDTAENSSLGPEVQSKDWFAGNGYNRSQL